MLGFIRKMVVPEASLAIVVSPDEPDGAALNLEPNDNPTAKTYQEALYRAGLPLIVFGAKDAKDEYERLTQLGVIFREAPTTTEYGTQALFEDTCGNLILLHQD